MEYTAVELSNPEPLMGRFSPERTGKMSKFVEKERKFQNIFFQKLLKYFGKCGNLSTSVT